MDLVIHHTDAWNEPIERLPPASPARAKLASFQQRFEDAEAISRRRSRAAVEADEQYGRSRLHLENLERDRREGRLVRVRELPREPVRALPPGDKYDRAGLGELRPSYYRKPPPDIRVEPDEERFQAEVENVARLKARRDAARAAHTEASQRTVAWRATCQRCAGYLIRLPRGLAVELHDGKAPALHKGENPAVATERVRAEIAGLAEERERMREAPYTAAEAKALVRAQVAELAERGRPGVDEPLFRRGRVSWPTAAGLFMAQGRDGNAAGVVTGEFADPAALVAWLHRDALLAKLEAEIDAAAKANPGISAEDRIAREEDLLVRILAAERAEEALIEMAERGGAEILRRLEADPRALLGLADSMPAPSGDD